MPSPAEKYSKFRNRYSQSDDSLQDFLASITVHPDQFQLEAFHAISKNHSVLVAAPTGSGKTLIAEYAIRKTLSQNYRIFYTTPIKALSNQKYREFRQIFGEESVGLLTGDRKMNPDAKIVVMTTEILRNMLYAHIEKLSSVNCVVMDEVHFLSDKHRGSVWEESFILLPREIRIVCLSATVSNVEEFGDWLNDIRGNLDVVVSEQRPVPLIQMVALDGNLHELLIHRDNKQEKEINPTVSRINSRRRQNVRSRYLSFDPYERRKIIEQLDKAGQLPCIYFIFSRNGCNHAAAEFLISSSPFLTKDEQNFISDFVESRVANLSPIDLDALDYETFIAQLKWGIATHHAGMIPLFKEIVEELFQLGILKVVFATETLSLGINMPAKTVVIESLRKFDGNSHVDLTAGEYTQLTGRAGRRGLDTLGYAVVPISETTSPATIASLVGTRTYQLRSSFRPNYNMSVNLINKYGLARGKTFLENSFAQFQASKSLGGLVKRVSEIENSIIQIESKYSSRSLKYAVSYLELLDEFEDLKNTEMISRFSAKNASERDLKTGSVFYFLENPTEFFVVTDVDLKRQTVSTISEKGFKRMHWHNFASWPVVCEHLKIPKGFNPNDRKARTALLDQVPEIKAFNQIKRYSKTSLHELDRQIKNHEFLAESNRFDLEKAARKIIQLNKDRERLNQRIRAKSESLSNAFENICRLLSDLDYLDKNSSVTKKGKLLSGLYLDKDLLLAETIYKGIINDLSLPDFGSVLSTFVFESRLFTNFKQISVPSKPVKDALIQIESIYFDIASREKIHNVSLTQEIDGGFANAVYDWLTGVSVKLILEESQLSPGDFVRWIKQLIDLANQISYVVDDSKLRNLCKQLIEELSYGIINASDSTLIDGEDVDSF